MLDAFLKQAMADAPVYITDVRNAFQEKGTRPFHIHVTLYDGTVRRFPLMLPETNSQAEAEFVQSYIHATVYNILSSLGAVHIDLYFNPEDQAAMDMAQQPTRVLCRNAYYIIPIIVIFYYVFWY